MTQNPFTMPQEMQKMAEKNIEQAQAAFSQFGDAMGQAMGMWTQAMPANEITSRFMLVQGRALEFAKQNAEAGIALANDLAKAQDIQQIMALQAIFAQSQMQSYALQAQELGRLMLEAAQANAQPMKHKS